MYGLVNAAFRELIVSNHGQATWERVFASTGLNSDSFARMEPYPDDVIYRMVQQGAEVLEQPVEQLLISFGEFWVEYTGREGYGAMFEIAGDSLSDFLLSLNELHTRVGRNFPKLKPPSFLFDRIDHRRLRMHYITDRAGLCPFVRGLLTGLSRRFRTELSVQQTECTLKGADHCVFMLELGEKR